MTPLFAPVVTFQSQLRSKFSYSLSETISPPCASLAVPRQTRELSSIAQLFMSLSPLKLCQPLKLLPSNKLTGASFDTSRLSFLSVISESVSVLVVLAESLQPVIAIVTSKPVPRLKSIFFICIIFLSLAFFPGSMK